MGVFVYFAGRGSRVPVPNGSQFDLVASRPLQHPHRSSLLRHEVKYPLALALLTADRSLFSFLRYGIGGVFPLFVRQLYAKLGVAWACSLIAFLLLAFLPVPFLFFIWGPAIRARSSLITAKPAVVAPVADVKAAEEGKESSVTTLASTA